MYPKEVLEFDALLKKHAGDDDDQYETGVALHYELGIAQTIEILREAAGRKIDFVYGKGYDNLEEIRFIDREDLKKYTVYKGYNSNKD